MRAWRKYLVSEDVTVPPMQPISSTFEEHAADLGGYETTEWYATKESFFDKYFFQQSRIRNYYDFIRGTLTTEQEILSIGSGRCANECKLMEDGYHVTCSDLVCPDHYPAAKKLFPELRHKSLDIISGPATEKYDAVLCLSLIYLFDERDLHRFFLNAGESLVEGGHLVLDSAGANDNLLLYLLDNWILKLEARFLRVLKSLKARRSHLLVTKHHGYRHTIKDVLSAANTAGFELVAQQSYDHLSELERIHILRRSMENFPVLRGVIRLIGRYIPYTRMYLLKKLRAPELSSS